MVKQKHYYKDIIPVSGDFLWAFNRHNLAFFWLNDEVIRRNIDPLIKLPFKWSVYPNLEILLSYVLWYLDVELVLVYLSGF